MAAYLDGDRYKRNHEARKRADKAPCIAETQGNIADLVAGASDPVDGVSLTVGDRVFVGMNQTAGAERGIYRVDTVGTGANGAWSRSFDLNNSDDLLEGCIVQVLQGTVGEDKFWSLTTDAPTLGTTALTFVDVTSSAAAVAANTAAIAAAVSTTVGGAANSGKLLEATATGRLTGALTYKGTWDANANTPTLSNGGVTESAVDGDVYVVSTPGATSLDGNTTWHGGDQARFVGAPFSVYIREPQANKSSCDSDAADAGKIVVYDAAGKIDGVDPAVDVGANTTHRGSTGQDHTDAMSAAAVDVAADSVIIQDADDSNAPKLESLADLATAQAGAGIAASSGQFIPDLNGLTAAVVDVSADSIAIVDANDSNSTRKESIVHLSEAMAGQGLGPNAGALELQIAELTGAAVDVATDSIAFVDANDSNASRLESIADLVAAMAGTNLTAASGVLSSTGIIANTSVFWVSNEDGNDSNGGTSWGDMKATIGSAYTAASAGDLIVVLPGTYSEPLTLAKNIQIMGYTADPAAVNITSGDATVVDLQAANITLANLTVTSTGTNAEGIRNDEHASVTGGTIRLVNVDATHSGGGASLGAIDLTTNAAADQDYYLERVNVTSNSTSRGMRIDENGRTCKVTMRHVDINVTGGGAAGALDLTLDGDGADTIVDVKVKGSTGPGAIVELDPTIPASFDGFQVQTGNANALRLQGGSGSTFIGDCSFINASASSHTIDFTAGAAVVFSGANIKNTTGVVFLDLFDAASNDIEFRSCVFETAAVSASSPITWGGGGAVAFYDCDLLSEGATTHTGGVVNLTTATAANNFVWRGGSIRCPNNASQAFEFNDASWTSGTARIGPCIIESDGGAWLEMTAGTGVVEDWGVMLDGAADASVSSGTLTEKGDATATRHGLFGVTDKTKFDKLDTDLTLTWSAGQMTDSDDQNIIGGEHLEDAGLATSSGVPDTSSVSQYQHAMINVTAGADTVGNINVSGTGYTKSTGATGAANEDIAINGTGYYKSSGYYGGAATYSTTDADISFDGYSFRSYHPVDDLARDLRELQLTWKPNNVTNKMRIRIIRFRFTDGSPGTRTVVLDHTETNLGADDPVSYPRTWAADAQPFDFAAGDRLVVLLDANKIDDVRLELLFQE